jgi:hypothetical protein
MLGFSMNLRILPLAFAALFILDACSSGKAALKNGDYYEAVLESVNRLRAKPNHTKAKTVLTQSYQLAVDFLQTGIQNGISSDDPKKWRNAVAGYEKINFLNDQIRTSLGAMKIITNPVTKFKELAEAKGKAAEESYQAGIQFMMGNSRENSKQAYFSFKEANGYEPGYREVIEMMTQAEFNATLRVAYQEINASRINYGSLQPIINSMQRQFLSFKPIEQRDTVPPQQYLRIVFNSYRQDNQTMNSSRNENLQKDVKVGEKKGADGKPQDVMETVKGTITYYTKTKRASSNATITITDANTNAILQNNTVEGNSQWQYTWATFKGDTRALTSDQLNMTKRKEEYPDDQALFTQAMKNLEQNVSQRLRSFYDRY